VALIAFVNADNSKKRSEKQHFSRTRSK